MQEVPLAYKIHRLFDRSAEDLRAKDQYLEGLGLKCNAFYSHVQGS